MRATRTRPGVPTHGATTVNRASQRPGDPTVQQVLDLARRRGIGQLTPQAVQRLQAAAGNAAVTQLLGGLIGRRKLEHAPSVAAAPHLDLARADVSAPPVMLSNAVDAPIQRLAEPRVSLQRDCGCDGRCSSCGPGKQDDPDTVQEGMPVQRLQATLENQTVAQMLHRSRQSDETSADEAVHRRAVPVQRACGASCTCGPCAAGALTEREEISGTAAVQRSSTAQTVTLASSPRSVSDPTITRQLPAPREDLDGHLDLLAGAALVGVPVVRAAQQVGQVATVQRFSLNPLDWAKKVWNGIKDLGSAALNKAKSLGSAALNKAIEVGSGVASTVGAAISGALSTVAAVARSGVAKLGDAAKLALQTLGSLARRGISAVGKVARGALNGALRLGKAAWDKAVSVGRKALDVAMGAGRAVVGAGKSLASKAWGVVKGKVGGLWNGLKAKAGALKNKVLSGAKGLLAKAKALGGKAVGAAMGLASKIGGSICSAIGKATAWIYGKVAPLAKKAWEWVKQNPAKTIAMLLIPGGPLIALGVVLGKKMLGLAKQLFAPVVKAIAAKAKAAWNKAKEWGAKAFNTAKQWAGKALSGATALGKKALNAATNFGRNVIGKAKDLGGKIIGKAKEWGTKVLGKAKDLGGKVWGKAKQLGGKLLGIADSLTGGMASKVKGLADKMLGKAAGVLSWVMSKAKSLASRALSSAKALASKVLAKAKTMASTAWNKAKELGSKLAGKAKDFATSALRKGKDLLVRAGKAAVDFGKRALQGAKNLAGKAVAKAKEWGAKAWSTAKQWGAKAWAKAKEWGGKAWNWTKQKAGHAWNWAKGIGAKLAPYARQAWEWAKKIGKAIGVDKAIAAVKALGKKALDLAKKGLVLLKDKVLPVVEKLRQIRNKAMGFTVAGALCKAVGCAYKGFIPKQGGKDLEGGLDLATDIIPVVSTVKDTCTCLVGENFVTNKQVGAAEQGMACTFAAIDIAGYVGAAFTGGATAAGAIALRTALKGGIKAGGKIIAKEALEAAIKKGGRELAEKLGKEGLQELAEKLGKEGLQELAEKMGKEEFEKLAKEAAEQGVKGFDDLLQKGAKEAGEAASEKGTKELADVATKKTADGASEIKVKSNSSIEVCPIQRCPSLKETLGSAVETPAVAKHADAAETAAKEGKAGKAADEAVDAVSTAKKTSMPDWLRKRFEAGNKFDDEMAEIFDRNYRQILNKDPALARDPEKLAEELRKQVRHELGVTTEGKYYRLDTLLSKGPSGSPEIISRKFTQISDIQPDTAKGYVNELLRKYQPGSEIVNPAKGTPTKIPDNAVQVLQIPVQKLNVTDPKMKEFLVYAKGKGVIVRDASGKDLTALV
jgi:hypothetical protein